MTREEVQKASTALVEAEFSEPEDAVIVLTHINGDTGIHVKGEGLALVSLITYAMSKMKGFDRIIKDCAEYFDEIMESMKEEHKSQNIS